MTHFRLLVSLFALLGTSGCGDVVAVHLSPNPLCSPLALGDSMYVVASADRSNFPVQAYSSITRPEAFSWSSSAPEVVAVSRAGIAYAKGIGTATIAAKTEGFTATVEIRVAQASQSAAVTPANAMLKTGDTVMLSAKAWDASGGPVNLRIGETLFSTDGDASIAAVYDQSPGGAMLVGVAPGTGHVTWRIGQRCGALPVVVK